jgi:lysophospholipid acyltransferase (LPLAT)-like uncharacterized protein
MRPRSNLPRRIRFFILQKLVLPAAVVPLKILFRSWRRRGPDPAVWQEMANSPRVIIVTYHGMFLHLLAYADLIPKIGRRLLVMLTPSLDGRLLGAAFRHFEIDYLLATHGQRGVAGSLEFIGRVENHAIGLIAVDGPRGPALIAQKQVLQIARAANAEIYLAITSAGRGLRFRSWDHAHLPFPFATIEFRMQRFSPSEGSDSSNLGAMQAAMAHTAREIRSPLFEADSKTE